MNMEVIHHHHHHHSHHHHHQKHPHQDSSGFENAVREFVDEAPGDLLEKSWFFGNSLERKTKMTRSHSDPCPSSMISDGQVGKSFEETYESLQKLPSCSSGNLMRRTPSLPVESSRNLYKGIKSRPPPAPAPAPPPPPARFNLSRAPSLQSTLTNNEEIHEEEESEFSMSKLIRQASLKTPEKASPLPPRRIPKASGLSSSAPPRNRQRRKSENPKTENFDQGKASSASRVKLGRSSSDAFAEINKGFKDMSLKISESQDYSRGGQSDGEEPKKVHSLGHERWKKLQRSVSSSMEKKSAEDMKAQIKFWARAVASNVRQEC